jgi:hypothetical protein
VERLVVTEIDARNRPPSSVFQLDFPEPVRVPDISKRVVYARGKTWSLLKLPSPSSPGTESFQTFGSGLPPELPGEIEAATPWTMIVLAGAVFFLLAGSIVVLKRGERRLRGVRRG